MPGGGQAIACRRGVMVKEELAEELQLALEHRILVERAKGMRMGAREAAAAGGV
jgi:hypothetical protein